MIAVIADDLTGAAEIAGLGWRHGLSVEILERDQMPSNAELVVFNADTRDCSAAEARRRFAAITRRLRERKPEWIYKKVDSVLRGNVLAEIEAMQRALGFERCLLAPANPAARRVIKDGKYFVRGVPINQTDFRHDPAHPRRSASVRELLGSSRKSRVTLRNPTAKTLPDGVVVAEAARASDVHRWASRVDWRTLPAGGADFFTALLARQGFKMMKARAQVAKPAAGSTLFVSGSLAESSIEFLDDCRAREWPVLLMPYELFAGRGRLRAHQAVWAGRVVEALEQSPRVAMGIGQPTLPGRKEGLRLGKNLTDTVMQVLARIRPERICVEGGSTAALLLNELGWKRLAVECEFATGVTGVRHAVRGGMMLVFKPGSYTWPASVTS
ncbi:MAG: hypothetical protein RLY20_2433 [Verrucomicrobiota bacterium]